MSTSDPRPGKRFWAGLVRRSGTVQSMGVVALGSMVGHVLTVAGMPLLTRLYAPAAFGVYAAFVALLSLLSVASTGGMELAVTSARKEEVGDLLAVGRAVAYGVALVAGGLALAAPIGLAGTASITDVLVVVGTVVWARFALRNAVATRQHDFRGISQARVSQSGATVVLQLCFGWWAWGSPGLLVAAVVGKVVALQRLPRGPARATARVRAIARERASYMGLTSGAALLNGSAGQLAPLAIVAIYGPATGGQFAIAHQLLTVPLALFGQAVSSVSIAAIGRQVAEQRHEAQSHFRRVTLGLFGLGLVPFALVAVVAERLVPAVLGDAWVEAGTIVSTMAPMYAVQLAMSPMGRILAVVERPGLQFAWDAARSAAVVAIFVVAAAGDLGFTTTLRAYVAVMVLGYLVLWPLLDRALAAVDRAALMGPAT